ncbi:MAG: hypothetical protein QUS09_08525, partial [Methanotrichaceae archaeon]|nr:hypothetical protein [Methanotrichaceae archaeon]
MDDILKDFERTPDEEAIKKVREASLEALATRHIDLNKILGEQQKAKENRLVPEYVEEFFKRAAQALGIKMEKRQDGFWRISSIPFEIRNQPYDFKAKFGEVQREYARVSFDKEKAFKGQAEFVAMGHPLLEAVVSTILSRYASCAADGATFVDPDGKREGIIWFLQAEIKDGKNEVAGKRLFAVYQDKNNSLSLLNPAVLWDLKPVAETAAEMPVDKDFIINFVITNGLEDYKWELLERRLRDAGIKKKYGIRSIESLIMESEGKISEYETRRMKGEAIPDATIQNEKRRREDLDLKKARLQREIEAEVHLYPSEPTILGAVRVMAGKASSDMTSDEEVEQIGMRVAMEYEISHNRAPE